MAALTITQIGDLLTPWLPDPSDVLLGKLSLYLDLLLKWNARTNLTSIRTPEEVVTRHFGESLFAARHLGDPATLLDYGSGAGFPGLPIALLKPAIRVTLAESQNKKATFLREAVRVLGLSVEIWPRRVEEMPTDLQFQCVTLRAVDNMRLALQGAVLRATEGVVMLTSQAALVEVGALAGFAPPVTMLLPLSSDKLIATFQRM